MTDADTPALSRLKLDSLVPDAPDVLARVACAVGIGETNFPLEEIYWGTRKLFEVLASERPLVVAIEDAHWAEAAFLDLVEYLADHVAAPLLVVCSGRLELLELRPAGGTTRTGNKSSSSRLPLTRVRGWLTVCSARPICRRSYANGSVRPRRATHCS